MKNVNEKSKFIWIPRTIAIIFILFIAMFSLDVFEMGGSIFAKLIGFIIHSLPSIFMAIILAIFWNKPYKCGWVFLILGVLFTLGFRTFRAFDIFLLISFPPLLVGALFIVADKLKKKG